MGSAETRPEAASAGGSIGSQSQGRARIWQTLPVRRSLGGLILLISAGLFALAAGAFWMERVAFTPEPTTDTAFAILGDEEIRLQVASIIAGADAEALNASANELRQKVNDIAQIPAGATEMRRFTAAAHARVIGQNDDAVEILPAEQVQIVRTERAAVLPPVTLPVEKVTALAIIGSLTSWVWLVSFAVGAVALLLGLALRPERGEASFAFAYGSAGIGASLLLFGYVIPGFVLGATSNAVWAGALPRLAAMNRTSTLVAALVFVAIGAAAGFLTSGNRQRRQRSTPLAATRFREPQRWTG